jgi:hypothetical protein
MCVVKKIIAKSARYFDIGGNECKGIAKILQKISEGRILNVMLLSCELEKIWKREDT